MKYTCVNATNGIEYDLKATNEQEAILEAFGDVTSGFDAMSLHDFDQDVINGRTCCHIDKWADDAGEDDDPVASTYIAWNFEFQTDYNTQDNYVLKEIRADLFDDTRLTASDNEDFRVKISNHYHKNQHEDGIMKKTNDAEHNTYAMAISEVMTNFLNDCENGNENAANEATDVLTKKFSLDIQQKAAMKIILSHMEFAVCHVADEEILSHWVGLNVNIMARIAVKDWQDVIDRLD